KEIQKDFPILKREIMGNRLVYLDNAATTQKPCAVIDALVDYYSNHNANVHRGIHTLSEEATELYENARNKVAAFIGASPDEIIFTKGATESLNRVAFEYGLSILKPGDKIVISNVEHHSNLVPWQVLAQKTNATLVYLEVDAEGKISLEDARNVIDSSTKIVAVTHASNVLGTIFPIKEIAQIAKKHGAIVCVDGAQAVPNIKVNMQSLGVDFYCFSGHKILGPTGIGVLWGRKALLEKIPPFEYVGGMIDTVSYDSATWAEVPYRFEAGTPNVADAIGLGAALDYVTALGMDSIREHEIMLNTVALDLLLKIKGVNILGPLNAEERTGLISFTVEGIHGHDIAAVLNSLGIAVRSGHHCAMPYHKKLNISASTRASWYIYNDAEDIKALADGIEKAKQMLG
ncbi:cysteine desulfurase, partial [candidate division WWE3 bacterium]|nr:cysteine desulfurase [candidate division WWE3 bacterium]